MSLLGKEIERIIRSQSGGKVRFHVDSGKLDSARLKSVGRQLGTTTAAATIKEAFLFAAALHVQPDKGLLGDGELDSTRKVVEVIEDRAVSASARKQSPRILKVLILRWNLLVLGKKLLGSSQGELKTTEQVANTLLKLCDDALASLFSAPNNG